LIIINHGKIIASGTLDEILKIAGVLDLNDAFAKLTGSENLEMKLQNFINKIKP